jgi:molecular chaperone GrpE
MTDEQTPAVEDDGDEFLAAADAQRIAELEAEVAALKDQALRYLADAENTKRRAEREVNDSRAYAIQKFAQSLFGVADNLQRALMATPQSDDKVVKNFVLGIEMTEKALHQAFESNGVKRIEPARGEKFDPHKHQAMMEQDAPDVEPGSVLQVMQAGYELYGRNVRPAMVVTASKAAAAPAPANPYAQTGEDEAGGAIDAKA